LINLFLIISRKARNDCLYRKIMIFLKIILLHWFGFHERLFLFSGKSF